MILSAILKSKLDPVVNTTHWEGCIDVGPDEKVVFDIKTLSLFSTTSEILGKNTTL